jgi:nucleoside-diphosphate-sugar epimerase
VVGFANGVHPAAWRGCRSAVLYLMPESVLVVGCGFVGLPLARDLAAGGWETHAITASEASAAKLHNEPFATHGLDISDKTSFERLARHRFDLVIHCASSGRGGASSYAAVFLGGIQNLMATLSYGRLIFTSSTSVYAQKDGSTVDETSPADPTRETGQILRKTEDLVLAGNGVVARLAGLYGPGRCAPLQKLLEGRATIEEDGTRRMNMLHQVDAAGALGFLAKNELSGIYNVVDNEPATEIDWYQYVCHRLNKPLPPFGPRDLNRKRGWTNKRVSNRKLRSLGWDPVFPTFKEGIEEIGVGGLADSGKRLGGSP